jgi:putative nucleotidyltransferase with HDIG domain
MPAARNGFTVATMNHLSVLCDSPADAQCVRQGSVGIFETRFLPADHRLREAEWPGQYIVIGINLNDLMRISDVKHWLRRKPKDAKVIFIVDKASRLEAARAYAIGATDLVHRPVDGKALLAKLHGDIQLLADPSDLPFEKSPGIAAAFGALQDVFASACLGQPLDQVAINTAGEAIVREVETEGLAAWIATVRKHHGRTYQHSLLVTGLVVAFGRQLGLPHTHLKRLSFAGVLHDIGKSKIPISVLEKPGPLDDNEIAIMRQHPVFGLDTLKSVPGLPAEMIDAVAHHHEYLDGSGYPHKLKGAEISDLVRILTIADIFAALIERRSYKPPLSGEAAYKILLDMGPKLDKDLVREFSSTSHCRIPAA